jgi:beta-lactamase class A
MVSLFFLLGAIILTVLQLVRFSRLWGNFPIGMTIAGIPVGQLNRQQAAERLLAAYALPIEIHYGEAIIQLSPGTVGFELDMDSMLAAADQERTRRSFWNAYWDYLWGRTSAPVNVPLDSTYSEERLRFYLTEEISKRYDQPPIPALPATGTVSFKPGVEGTALDIDRSVLQVENALWSPTQRVAILPLERTTPPRPAFQNLEVMLRQTIELSGFDGIMGVYVLDLQTGQEINLAYSQGAALTTPPEVAFSASSTIKIGIMISVFRRIGENPDAEVIQNLADMIGKSINPASDWLMENVLDRGRGPLVVSEDLQKLGLENTFLAGYFAPGSPLLKVYQTPANQQNGVYTEPDPYNQTIPSEIGTLIGDIYLCAQNNSGALIAAFPDEITQAECQAMIRYLEMDRNPLLIEKGLPDGTPIARKHGWIPDIYGVIHDTSDVAIVFTPGGNFVMAVFMYHPVQLIYDPANALVSSLAQAVYNYYNLPTR